MEKFDYVYSAPTEAQRKEIESIRNSYAEVRDVDDGLRELRKLDNRVQTPPRVLALTLGIVALLIFGLGMTMVLQWSLFIWGCIVGVVGVAAMVGNYFLYKLFLARRKAKFAERIKELSDKLLSE